MGQMTYGLMYGIEDNVDSFDSEEWLEAYEDANRDAIKLLEGELNHWDACSQIVPSYTVESDLPILGFFVGVGASGMEGVPYLETCRVEMIEIDTRYAESLAAARKRWSAFSVWCEGRGVKLPEPALWLVETEVA